MLFHSIQGAGGFSAVVSGFPVLSNITTTAKGSTGTTVSVNLPSGISSGNGLIIILTQYGGGTFTTPSGWTLLNSTATTGLGAPRTAVYARVASGTEGSTQAISTSTTNESTAISFKVTNWFGAVTSGMEATASNQTTTTPDPPSLTASWGSANNLWIAYVGSRGSRNLTAYPTNYTLYQTQALNPSNSTRGETFMAGRELATATENPGTFTFDSTSREVVAGTLVIRGI